MLPFVAVQTTLVAHSASAVVTGIAIEQLTIEAVRRYSDSVVVPWNRCEVACHHYGFRCCLRLSGIGKDALIVILAINPGETLRVAIHFI